MKGRPVRLTRRGRIAAFVGACVVAFWFGSFGLADTCWTGDGWGSCEVAP
jgi:hypothetical protein